MFVVRKLQATATFTIEKNKNKKYIYFKELNQISISRLCLTPENACALSL